MLDNLPDMAGWVNAFGGRRSGAARPAPVLSAKGPRRRSPLRSGSGRHPLIMPRSCAAALLGAAVVLAMVLVLG